MKRLLLLAAALLVLVVAASYALYRRDLAAARRQLAAGSELADTACGRIEYALTGSGPAVLIVHGAGGGYSQVAALAELLAASGFTAVSVSRFGYLRTPLPADASPAAQADAHACLLERVGLARAAVIGLSAGAPSAIEFCARHPARCSALVLLVPAIAVPGLEVSQTTPPSLFWQFVFDVALTSDYVIWSLIQVWPEILVETVLATPVERFRSASPAERRRALAVIRDVFPVSLKSAGLRNDARVTTRAPLPALETIQAPTLAISARDDLYRTDEGASHAASRIAGAQLLLFPDGGHAWLGHDEEVRAALVAFLRASR